MLKEMLAAINEVIAMLKGLHEKVDRIESKLDDFHNDVCGAPRPVERIERERF